MLSDIPVSSSHEVFNGFYRAVVEDNQDPLKSGRVKVRVYPVFKDISVEALPWAIYADALMGGASNSGGIFIPVVGSHVFVFFENGDHRFPVYFAGAPAIENETPDIPSEARGVKYPNNRVFKTKKGIVIEYDDSDGDVRIKFTHPSGTNRVMSNEGNLTETVVGIAKIDATGKIILNTQADCDVISSANVNVTATGNISLTANGNVSITASGNVDVTGTTINLN